MKSILIADDDEFYSTLLRNHLASDSCTFDIAHDGKAVIAKLKSASYDLLILDVHMDAINGVQVLSIVKNMLPQLPVIMITGDTSLELERTVRSYGVFYYLMKPHGKKELAEVVELALRKHGADRNTAH